MPQTYQKKRVCCKTQKKEEKKGHLRFFKENSNDNITIIIIIIILHMRNETSLEMLVASLFVSLADPALPIWDQSLCVLIDLLYLSSGDQQTKVMNDLGVLLNVWFLRFGARRPCVSIHSIRTVKDFVRGKRIEQGFHGE